MQTDGLQISLKTLESKLGSILSEAEALKQVIDVAYQRLYAMVLNDFIIDIQNNNPDLDTDGLTDTLWGDVVVNIKDCVIEDLEEKAEELAMVALKAVSKENIYKPYSKPGSHYIEGIGAEDGFSIWCSRYVDETIVEEDDDDTTKPPHVLYNEFLMSITRLLKDNLGG